MLHGEEKQKVLSRLKRVEGQVAGVRRMIENDTYCVDVLTQISAAQAALAKIGGLVLAQHMETCVAQAFDAGEEEDKREKIDELMTVFARYARLPRG